MADTWSFKVVIAAGQPPVVTEVDGTVPVPAGLYQVSGYDNASGDNPSSQRAITIVQHDSDGAAIVGATGYRE